MPTAQDMYESTTTTEIVEAIEAGAGSWSMPCSGGATGSRSGCALSGLVDRDGVAGLAACSGQVLDGVADELVEWGFASDDSASGRYESNVRALPDRDPVLRKATRRRPGHQLSVSNRRSSKTLWTWSVPADLPETPLVSVDDEALVGAEEGWLTPGVAGIGTASLLADVGHEIPTALLPSLLTSTLGAPASALGLIEGVSDGLAGLARFGGGALADDPARRRTIAVGGYSATAILAAGTGAATAMWQVGLLRAGAWAARGLRVPARNALLADVVHPTAYGRAYGFERAMDNLGAIIGPLLAIGLVAAVGTRWAIGLSVLPGLLAAGAIIYAIRRTPAPRSRERVPIRLQVRPVLHGGLGRLFAGVSAFELGNCAATLLILRATELLEPGHGQDMATTIALGLYVTYNAAATLTSLAAGRVSDRRSARVALVFGVAAFAIAYLGFSRDVADWWALVPWFLAAGVGIGFVEAAEHAAVAGAAPTQLRGSAFGLLAGVQSLGNLAASAIAGLLWSAFSPSWAFAYLAGWMLLALVLLLAALTWTPALGGAPPS
jgi:MFS family permease